MTRGSRSAARQASRRPASGRSSPSADPGALSGSAPKLFGTDGVRGEAGSFLTAELALAVGRAGAAASEAERPQVLIVRDTRESGPTLEAALAAGISEAGGDAFLGGVLPTPAAAILTARHGFDLAAVVSASHNPYRDNGIKFFGPGGDKLGDGLQRRIEELIHRPPEASSRPGRVDRLNGAERDYLRELEDHFRLDLGGLTVALDCAHGATYRVAPRIFRQLGAEVRVVGAEPDGRNINDGCGSTAMDLLAELVGSGEADIGFAFDGDGDRVLAVDGTGRVRDGDELIALCARELAAGGRLGGGVAVTVMTNYGFHTAMEEAGIEVAITSVGDRHVLEALKARGWRLGGEQSGHIIATDYAPTGDGIAAALMTMRALAGRPLEEVPAMEKLPQVLTNVTVADRDAVADAAAVWEAVDAENAALEGRGRVLVRPSGTEPMVRVMVEAPTAEEAARVRDRLVELVESELA